MSQFVGKGELQQHNHDQGQAENPTKEAINTLFKEAIVGRSWKNREAELVELYRQNQSDFTQASQSIMLKIIMIPSAQQKQADLLMQIYFNIYEVLNKQFKKLKLADAQLEPLFKTHLETSFKLTQHKQKINQMRAYGWLDKVLEHAPQGMTSNMKKRVLKSVFTHALNVAQTSSFTQRYETTRVDAIKVTAKLQDAVKQKGREDYYDTIGAHLIKIMMEEERDRVRKQAVVSIHITEKTLPFIIKKTLDVSPKVRSAVYKTLMKNNTNFDKLSWEDRISVVMNGLRDSEPSVTVVCKSFLASAICVKPGEEPQPVKSDQIGQLRFPKAYLKHQLQPLDSILKNFNIRASYRHIQISECMHLMMRDVVFPTYGMQAMQEQVETLVQTKISQQANQEQLPQLYEDLVFVNFYFHILKQLPMASQQCSKTEQYGVSVPKLKVLKKMLDYCLNLNDQSLGGSEQQVFEQKLPTLVVYQVLRLANHLMDTLPSDSKRESLLKLMVEFLQNKKLFNQARDFQQPCFSTIEEIKQEEQSLSEIGIYIKERETLLQVAIQIIRTLECPNYDKFLASVCGIIDKLKPQESLQQSLSQLRCQLKNLTSWQGLAESSIDPQTGDTAFQLQCDISTLESQINSRITQQLTLMKYFLKTVKIKLGNHSLFPSLNKHINTYLYYENYDIQNMAVECLGLLMILNKDTFYEKLSFMMDCVSSELDKRKKSQKVVAAIKTIFDCLMVHGFMLESENLQDFLRLDLRNLLMRLLRDIDYNIRLLVTEGFCKLLICERIQNPWDFIARLMLLYFEKSNSTEEHQDKTLEQMKKAIKKTLEDFFSHFVRLSLDRCIELFGATIEVIYYLFKSQTSSQKDPQWSQINHFYLFGTMSDHLKYKTNKLYAIFDQAESGISFQLQFLKFFSFFLLSDKLADQEKNNFFKFMAHSLNFLDLEEIPYVVRDFEKEFEESINPIFALISQFYHQQAEQRQINDQWKKIALVYVKRRNQETNTSAASIDNQVVQIMNEGYKKKDSFTFDDEQEQIHNHCVGFYSSVSKSFREQKSHLDDYNQDQPPNDSLINYKRQAQKALKHLEKKTPNLKVIMKDKGNIKKQGKSMGAPKEEPCYTTSKKKRSKKEKGKAAKKGKGTNLKGESQREDSVPQVKPKTKSSSSNASTGEKPEKSNKRLNPNKDLEDEFDQLDILGDSNEVVSSNSDMQIQRPRTQEEEKSALE